METQIQPLINYANAGYKAFRMAYSPGYFGSNYASHRPFKVSNPYGKHGRQSQLWRRGWDEAEKEWEKGIPMRDNPFEKNRRILGFVHALEKQAQNKGFHPHKKHNVKLAKPQSETSLRGIEKFNRKNRTIV